MTSPLPLFDDGKLSHFRRLESRFHTRDLSAELIHQVRRGNIQQLFPEELDFSISFNGSPIANFVDIVAHDMSEGIAPLPALACTSGKMQADSDLKRATTKNRIGDNYWRHSRLEVQMLKGADRYVTYGFLPFFVEPNTDAQMPYIHVEDPRYAYYELDRFGCTKVYAKRLLKSVDELCALFPEWEGSIRKDKDDKVVNGDTLLKMVRWIDSKTVTLFLPERNGLILSSYQHKLSRCPVKIAERPSEDDNPRGQFDDVIWVQVARSIMSTLALEAASIAVQAPIAVPDDMDELAIGPHAIMQSSNSKDIHKVALEMPPQIFAENQLLDQEMKLGARYPDARTGGVQGASVITGKGVEALLGTFDSQIKGAQMILREALEQVTSMCFEMDEVWWPNKTQTVNGTISGSSYEFSYTPSKDIAGRYACTVTYGFASGLSNPSQAAVMMLQLEGAGVISKHTMRDNLPMPMDGLTEERAINVEASREALKQGVFALVQATGEMAASGQDPTPIIHLSVNMIRALQQGMAVEDAVSQAYDQMAQAQQQAQQQAQEEQQEQAATQGGAPGPDGGGGGSFDGANGAPEAGVPGSQAPGQAGLPPGGRPAVADMIAGFRGNGNLPVNQFAIRRSVPTGT